MFLFGWDLEVDICSRFWRWNLIKICVQLVIWTQPMGLLCLWQCFSFEETFNDVVIVSCSKRKLIKIKFCSCLWTWAWPPPPFEQCWKNARSVKLGTPKGLQKESFKMTWYAQVKKMKYCSQKCVLFPNITAHCHGNLLKCHLMLKASHVWI